MVNRSGEARAITEAIERLRKTVPGLPPSIVEDAVAVAVPEFEGNPLRDFVPLFVERTARQRLRALV